MIKEYDPPLEVNKMDWVMNNPGVSFAKHSDNPNNFLIYAHSSSPGDTERIRQMAKAHNGIIVTCLPADRKENFGDFFTIM